MGSTSGSRYRQRRTLVVPRHRAYLPPAGRKNELRGDHALRFERHVLHRSGLCVDAESVRHVSKDRCGFREFVFVEARQMA